MNTIKIKTGSGKPSNGVLQKGELGYDTTNGFLYIGNASNNTAGLKVAYATSAGTAENATSLSGTLGIANGGTNATTAADALTNLGGVPTSRTINKKALTSNITLTAADVGARASSWMPTAADVGARASNWMPTAADVGAVPTSRTVNGKALSANITISASDISAVPTSRKINSKALSSDITLTASDVGARASTWTPSASDVGAVPTSRKINGKALTSDITLSASDISGLSSSGCETATAKAISGNSTGTFSFSKSIKAVFVTAYASSSAGSTSGFWDLNTSGRQQAMYGYATSSLDTWTTKVTISGSSVTVQRVGSTALYYSVTAFF